MLLSHIRKRLGARVSLCFTPAEREVRRDPASTALLGIGLTPGTGRTKEATKARSSVRKAAGYTCHFEADKDCPNVAQYQAFALLG
jgi:hypothetical protein